MNNALDARGGAYSLAGAAPFVLTREPDSRARSFLQPRPPPPNDDLDLDRVLQAWVVGLTGLPGSLVRPRWQPAPPPMPDQGVNWCAIGVLSQKPDDNNWTGHDPNADGGLGNTRSQRNEEIEALASFYGPAAGGYAGLVRDNSQVDQNGDTLDPYGVAFVGAGEIRIVPDLVNQIWVRRADISLSLRRQINRTYAIRTLLDAPLLVADDQRAATPPPAPAGILPTGPRLADPPLAGGVVEMQAQWSLGAEVADGRFYFTFSARGPGTLAALDYIAGMGTFTASIAINGTVVPGLDAVSVTASRGRAFPLHMTAFAAGDQITGVITASTGPPTDAVLNLTATWT